MNERNHHIEKCWISPENYPCVVLAMHTGHRCGYVAIPPSHPFFGKDYDDPSGYPSEHLQDEPVGKRSSIDLIGLNLHPENVKVGVLFDVHGGITYSGSSEDGYPIETSDPYWWFGFDCRHAGDLLDLDLITDPHERAREEDPNSIHNRELIDGYTVKGTGYVVDECNSLSKQLYQYESNKE